MDFPNNKRMLIYGLNEEEITIIDDLINKNSLPNYIVIQKTWLSMKIKDILNGTKIEVLSDKFINERIILFNNFQMRN